MVYICFNQVQCLYDPIIEHSRAWWTRHLADSFCDTSVLYIVFLVFFLDDVITTWWEKCLAICELTTSEMTRTLLRIKAVPTNATLCKQLIIMGIPMVFNWFSSSSLTVPNAPTTTGITIVLTAHNFCTCNLKSLYLVIFPSFFTFMFWYLRTVMLIILHSLFSLSMATISGLRCSYLSGLRSPKVFYICQSAVLALVKVRTICLHIQSQIFCTGASVLFSKFLVSLNVLVSSLNRTRNRQYGWTFNFFFAKSA